MLHNRKTLEGYALCARDGDIGHMKDFYFDDHHWHIRYFVVDAGSWLPGRRVLISPEAVNGHLWADLVISVDLTQDQVRNSPSVDTAKPVSRQQETELRHHYGWPPYWEPVFPEAAMTPALRVAPLDAPTQRHAHPADESKHAAASDEHESSGDSHLRSIGEVNHYHVEATDGAIGHIDDFLIDDDWRIRYLVVGTRNWWPGKKVIVAPGWIREVSWAESKVFLCQTRATIKGCPEYDPSKPVTAEYAGRLHDYYGVRVIPTEDPDHKSAESRGNAR